MTMNSSRPLRVCGNRRPIGVGHPRMGSALQCPGFHLGTSVFVLLLLYSIATFQPQLVRPIARRAAAPSLVPGRARLPLLMLFWYLRLRTLGVLSLERVEAFIIHFRTTNAISRPATRNLLGLTIDHRLTESIIVGQVPIVQETLIGAIRHDCCHRSLEFQSKLRVIF